MRRLSSARLPPPSIIAAKMGKSAEGLLTQLGENLDKDEALRKELIKKIKVNQAASCYRCALPPPIPAVAR